MADRDASEAISIRALKPEETRSFLEVHRAAVRGTAVRDYPPEIIEAWSPPISDERVERFKLNRHGELRLAAEIGGQIVGIGGLVPATGELRTCYVHPEAGRRGVGRALVGEIERMARELGLLRLWLDASLTAEPFYAALGYKVSGRGAHVLASGKPMACVHMEKALV